MCEKNKSRRSTIGTFFRIANVITSVEFERLADPMGPTGGKLVRPSDGKEAKKIDFIQCAGSRDRNCLIHCSRTSCMATFEQRINVGDAFDEDDYISVYYEVLPIQIFQLSAYWALPRHHRDPFDRMLVAQARAEALTLISRDPNIARYDVEILAC